MNPQTSSKLEQLKDYAPTLLRFGIALVFIYFSTSQISNPEKWVGILPDFIKAMSFSPVKFVLLNALFEIICAFLLIFGVYTRWVALLLAIHLAGVTATLGYTPNGVRDFGLIIACLGMFMLGSGKLALDNK